MPQHNVINPGDLLNRTGREAKRLNQPKESGCPAAAAKLSQNIAGIPDATATSSAEALQVVSSVELAHPQLCCGYDFDRRCEGSQEVVTNLETLQLPCNEE